MLTYWAIGKRPDDFVSTPVLQVDEDWITIPTKTDSTAKKTLGDANACNMLLAMYKGLKGRLMVSN